MLCFHPKWMFFNRILAQMTQSYLQISQVLGLILPQNCSHFRYQLKLLGYLYFRLTGCTFGDSYNPIRIDILERFMGFFESIILMIEVLLQRVMQDRVWKGLRCRASIPAPLWSHSLSSSQHSSVFTNWEVLLSLCTEFLLDFYYICMASLVAQSGKNLPAMQETQVRSLGLKIPQRRKWQSTPVFLPRKSLGHRSHRFSKSWT